MASKPMFLFLILLAPVAGCASQDETLNRAMNYKTEESEPKVVHGSSAINTYQVPQ